MFLKDFRNHRQWNEGTNWHLKNMHETLAHTNSKLHKCKMSSMSPWNEGQWSLWSLLAPAKARNLELSQVPLLAAGSHDQSLPCPCSTPASPHDLPGLCCGLSAVAVAVTSSLAWTSSWVVETRRPTICGGLQFQTVTLHNGFKMNHSMSTPANPWVKIRSSGYQVNLSWANVTLTASALGNPRGNC